MKPECILSWLCAAVLVVTFLACDGSDNDVTVMLDPSGGQEPTGGSPTPGENPGPASISGTWDTTSVETFDSCGFDPLPPDAALQIEEAGSAALFTYVDALGYCEPSVRGRNGDRVTLVTSDVFEACGGTVRVQSSIVYEFDGDGFSGTAEHHYTNITSQCSNLPCEYRMAVSGTRCEGCWPGCTDPAAFGRSTGTTQVAAPHSTFVLSANAGR